MRTSRKFVGVVRRCLALPYILLDELQAVVDDLKLSEMENNNVAKIRDNFMYYIQMTWISGVYSPEMWSCFGRLSDTTNNAQEAYNSIFNR